MNLFDPATQLPVEALFMDRLGQALALARRKQTQIAVVQLNPASSLDQASRLALAQRLQQVLRTSDTVAQLNPPAFTVLLNDVDSVAAARAVAEELALAAAKPAGDGTPGARIRYGLAVFPQDGQDEQALLKSATAGADAA